MHGVRSSGHANVEGVTAHVRAPACMRVLQTAAHSVRAAAGRKRAVPCFEVLCLAVPGFGHRVVAWGR
jgi:hypothetical protein